MFTCMDTRLVELEGRNQIPQIYPKVMYKV